MIQGRMLDNGKPQAGSAARLGPTLVHAIEPLKYLALFFRRDTDSRVGDSEERTASSLVPHCNVTVPLGRL